MNLPHLYTEQMWDAEARRRGRAIAAEYCPWMGDDVPAPDPYTYNTYSAKWYAAPCDLCAGMCVGHDSAEPLKLQTNNHLLYGVKKTPIEQIKRESVANVEATAGRQKWHSAARHDLWFKTVALDDSNLKIIETCKEWAGSLGMVNTVEFFEECYEQALQRWPTR